MVSRRVSIPPTTTLLRDVVGVRPHPTVVRLDHLQGSDAGWISGSYYLTDDVAQHLHALRTVLRRPTGTGIFLIGQYGSGKSHLLAYIVQQLQASAGAASDDWRELRTEVCAISLLNHPAHCKLEDIVLRAVQLPTSEGDRRATWSALRTKYPNGLLLLIDELSEFLRSKATPAAFQEDIRFLQFLGEWAQACPLWVLAAMQEQIEHLGDLEHGMFRKIKDRFPLRFLLTPSHVVDLLSQSILVKSPDYPRVAEAVSAGLRQAFPDQAAQLNELSLVFPVHPVTLQMLAEVRDQFSQSRGVVDFVVVQLNGCPERHVPPLLDGSPDRLLTPDTIVDHFRDLFELQSEFVPFAQQLLPYYEQHLAELMGSEPLTQLAWRVIKLLMLAHISPAREGVTAAEATYWLVYQASRIDPAKNQAVVQRVLDTLADQGRFVSRHNDRFSLNLQDDGGASLDRFLEQEKVVQRARGTAVLELLLPLLGDDDFHPFAFRRDTWQARHVRWQFHDRPYAVFVGNATTESNDGLSICIRLPWGERPISGVGLTVTPSTLDAGDELIELAALVRARQRFWSGKTAERLESRFKERLKLFRTQLRATYREATVTFQDGHVEPALAVEPDETFAAWLDRLAIVALRKTYPSFERFAPVHGPLPAEAFRSLMRFVASQDLGESDADDYVRLIREAYMVPMQLLKRRQREYILPMQPDNLELVRLVLPLVDSEPSPQLIYDHLQGPVYGLVADQVALLLVYLLILGEIDILKGSKSYRDTFETLANPLQYDRVVPGRALRGNQIQELITMCEGLQIRIPKQLTVMSQRRAVAEVRRRVAELVAPLRNFSAQLQSDTGNAEAAEPLRRLISQAAALQQQPDESRAFQQFIFECGSARRFLDQLHEYTELAEKLGKLQESIQRYECLLSHPNVMHWKDGALATLRETLGSAPPPSQLKRLQDWLEAAHKAYDTYCDSYRQRHETWRARIETHPVWTWQPHALCQSRHVGVREKVVAFNDRRKLAWKSRCPGLINLQFQATCHCGFDGGGGIVDAALAECETLRREIDGSLRHFFGQRKVRARMQQWLDEKIEVNAQTLAYVAEQADLPDVTDLDALDRYLAGIEIVKDVDSADLVQILQERTWEVPELLKAMQQHLARYGQSRLRFTSPAIPETDVLAWCVEHALRHGQRLPNGLPAALLETVVLSIQPNWVSPATLGQLERLGLGKSIENRIIRWLLDGHLALPDQVTPSSLLESLREVLAPKECCNPEDLAERAALLYQAHARLSPLLRDRWLARLDRLAREFPGPTPAALTARLPAFPQHAWVVIDALGLPLVPAFRRALPDLFPAWQFERIDFAQASVNTTTDQWYRDLVENQIEHAMQKVNVVDQLLHERFLPLDDLWRLAEAELAVACRRVVEHLPQDRELLIFADHGFRMSADGRRYGHGGNSALERIVPLIQLVPRCKDRHTPGSLP